MGDPTKPKDWFVNRDFDYLPREEEFRDFRKFLFFIFSQLAIQSPTRVQYDIAHVLQTVTDNLMIQAFRGVGKSWITAVYVLWRLYWNPALNVLVVSASETKASEFTTFCMRLLSDVEELHWLHPKMRPKRVGQIEGGFDNRSSALKFDVGPAPYASQSPSVRAAGIGGQITGSRADLIVPDDIEIRNNSLTESARLTLAAAVLDFDDILKPGGQVIYLGTPQTEESIYQGLPQRGYRIIIWPVQYPRKSRLVSYGDRLAPMLRRDIERDPSLCGPDGDEECGMPTDPERFNEAEVLKRRLNSTRARFALQYMLDPSGMDADVHPLHLRNFIVADVPSDVGPPSIGWTSHPQLTAKDLPCVGFRGDGWQRAETMSTDYVPYEDGILYVDPSGRGADETGVAVLKLLNAKLFLLKACGFRGGYEPATLEAIAKLAKEYRVKRVVTEDNFGDGMFRALFLPVLKKEYPECGLEGIKVPNTVYKEKRIIEAMEPALEQHRLVIHSRVILEDMQAIPGVSIEDQYEYRLFYQTSRITRTKRCLGHDDRLDALAGAIAVFQQALTLDADKNKARVLSIDHRRQVNKFMTEIGFGPKETTWIDKLAPGMSRRTPQGGVKRLKGGQGLVCGAEVRVDRPIRRTQ